MKSNTERRRRKIYSEHLKKYRSDAERFREYDKSTHVISSLDITLPAQLALSMSRGAILRRPLGRSLTLTSGSEGIAMITWDEGSGHSRSHVNVRVVHELRTR